MSVFVPFQGLKTISDMARDSSPQLASAPKRLCKDVTWEACDDLGSLGKAFSLPDLNLASGALAFCFLFLSSVCVVQPVEVRRGH